MSIFKLLKFYKCYIQILNLVSFIAGTVMEHLLKHAFLQVIPNQYREFRFSDWTGRLYFLFTETKKRVPPISRSWSRTTCRYCFGSCPKKPIVWPIREPIDWDTSANLSLSDDFNCPTHNQVPNIWAIKMPTKSIKVVLATIVFGTSQEKIVFLVVNFSKEARIPYPERSG